MAIERLAFTQKEVAEMIGVSEITVRRLVKAGKLARVTDVGDRVLIAKRTVERFVNNETEPEQAAG